MPTPANPTGAARAATTSPASAKSPKTTRPKHPGSDSEAADAAFVNKTLRTVFLALLIDILAFTIILPLFPRLLKYYETVDGKDE
ncbi:hypothetical protein HK102_008351, partial [Quaeritorhiza haematococci]